jgi:hypothetical protein
MGRDREKTLIVRQQLLEEAIVLQHCVEERFVVSDEADYMFWIAALGHQCLNDVQQVPLRPPLENGSHQLFSSPTETFFPPCLL